MDREIIVQRVTQYLNQLLSGQEVENPKLDFKKSWYDLTSKPGINEFLKDTSSIANTFGPDGYLIIGIDDKEKTQVDVSFSESGLKDTNELAGIINKGVDRSFELNYFEERINGKTVGILHIPPSLDKPHVIRNYQTFYGDGNLKKEESHRIFVRSGSTTKVSTKYDIVLMFYDRKNIHPDYILDIFINEVRFLNSKEFGTFASCEITLENIGKRPASIKGFSLAFFFNNNSEYKFSDPAAEFEIAGHISFVKIHVKNIIIKSNDIVQKRMKFFFLGEDNPKKDEFFIKAIDYLNKIEAELILNNGNKIIKECTLLFKKTLDSI